MFRIPAIPLTAVQFPVRQYPGQMARSPGGLRLLSFTTIPKSSTHACASNPAAAFRTPMCSSAGSARLASNHQSVKDCSRHRPWYTPSRAAAATMRAVRRADSIAADFSVSEETIGEKFLRGVVFASNAFHRRKPIVRKAAAVAGTRTNAHSSEARSGACKPPESLPFTHCEPRSTPRSAIFPAAPAGHFHTSPAPHRIHPG